MNVFPSFAVLLTLDHIKSHSSLHYNSTCIQVVVLLHHAGATLVFSAPGYLLVGAHNLHWRWWERGLVEG